MVVSYIQRNVEEKNKENATKKKKRRRENKWLGVDNFGLSFRFLLLLFGVVVVVSCCCFFCGRFIYYLHDKGIFVVELLLLVQSIGTKAAPSLCPAFAQVL